MLDAFEECDDGMANGSPGMCPRYCDQQVCGDGEADLLEECDDGEDNSDTLPDACRNNCTLPSCGDGVADPANEELCDDGNPVEDDNCRSTCLSNLCGNATVELQEQCDDGNLRNHDGCSSICVSESFQWRYVDDFPLVLDRADLAMTYDASHMRTIVFGGTDLNALLDDTWELEGWTRTWTERHPVVRPSARRAAAMAFFPPRGTSVLFGGEGGLGVVADLWEYDAGDHAWTPLDASAVPPARASFAMAYDSSRRRLVIFGGEGDTGLLGDTWEFDGTTWLEATPATSPSPRRSGAMAYDAARGVIVLYGGEDIPLLDDTWEYDGTAWTERHPSQTPGTIGSSSLCYYEAVDRIFLVNGEYSEGEISHWIWDGTDWTPFEPAGPVEPQGRIRHLVGYHGQPPQIVLLGGVTTFGDWLIPNTLFGAYSSDFRRLGYWFPTEDCSDGEDDDLDGQTDCDDSDCFGAPGC